MWMTQEMGFEYHSESVLYLHPGRGLWAQVSAPKLHAALAQGLAVQQVQGWIVDALFGGVDVESLGWWAGGSGVG